MKAFTGPPIRFKEVQPALIRLADMKMETSKRQLFPRGSAKNNYSHFFNPEVSSSFSQRLKNMTVLKLSSVAFLCSALFVAAPASAYTTVSCSVSTTTKSCTTASRTAASGAMMYASAQALTGYGQVPYKVYRGTTVVWQGVTDSSAAKVIYNTTSTNQSYKGTITNFSGLSGATGKLYINFY